MGYYASLPREEGRRDFFWSMTNSREKHTKILALAVSQISVYWRSQAKSLWHRELCSMLSGSLDRSGVWGRVDPCSCVAESLRCSPETITTLSVNWFYPNTKFKKFKVWKKPQKPVAKAAVSIPSVIPMVSEPSVCHPCFPTHLHLAVTVTRSDQLTIGRRGMVLLEWSMRASSQPSGCLFPYEVHKRAAGSRWNISRMRHPPSTWFAEHRIAFHSKLHCLCYVRN